MTFFDSRLKPGFKPGFFSIPGLKPGIKPGFFSIPGFSRLKHVFVCFYVFIIKNY